MIIIKLISGLGNQLFQYAVARQLAIKNGDRVKLDISFYMGQQMRNYGLKYFNINADIATEDDVASVMDVYKCKFILQKIYCGIESVLHKHYNRHYKEDGWWRYEPSLYKIKGNVYLEGYWQHYKYFEGLDKQIFDELSLKNASEAERYSVFDAVHADDSSVSLHIRRGDYVTDRSAADLMGILPLSYYERAIEYICERVYNPSFYIFSDDLEWARTNLKIKQPTTFVNIEDGKKDYLELVLMSRCRHNILANSSFSWWGGFLNQNKAKIVIAPKQWVKQPDVNKTIFISFPDWVQL
jgi:hypothetical protein